MIKDVLIKTTEATAMDCSHIERVTGIAIDSVEPENTTTRYLLSIDGGKWRKYKSGVWSFADVQDLTANSVLNEGNTKAELTALTANSLTAFAGKVIDVAVAMHIGNNAELPSINKFELKCENTQIKKDLIFSDVIELSDEEVGIIDIDVAKNEADGGFVEVYASVQNGNGEWSDYVPYNKVAHKGKAIRFKAEVEVGRPGVSTAILDNVKVYHWQSAKSSAIEGKAVLVTKPLTFTNNVNRAHAILRHPKIADTEFKVYIIFGDSEKIELMPCVATYERENDIEEDYEFVAAESETSKNVTLKIEIIQNSGKVTDEILGIGNGKQQAFKLAHHAKSETLQVVGSTDWIFKEKTDTLLVTAKSGNTIHVSYDWIAKTTYLTALACLFNS